MIVCYTKTDAGATINCPRCSQTMILAGELAPVATIRRVQHHTLPLIIIVIGGFALMVWFPIGTVLGLVLVVFAWKKSSQFVCSNCQTPLKNPNQRACSGCRAAFTTD
jgi:hypothetical protein